MQTLGSPLRLSGYQADIESGSYLGSDDGTPWSGRVSCTRDVY